MSIKKYQKTAQLYNKDGTDTNNGFVNRAYLNSVGEVGESANHTISEYIDVSEYSQITLSGAGTTTSSVTNAFYDENKTKVSYFYTDVVPKTVNVPTNAKYIRLTVANARKDTFMLNSDSTALDYAPYGSVWREVGKRYETSTDTITTLPTELIADSVSAYTIKGNMAQSDTPTASPIQSTECGVRTENLCNVTTDTSVFLNIGTSSGYSYTINDDKTIFNPEGKAFYGGFRIKVKPNTTYTCHSVASNNGIMRVMEYSDVITDLTTNSIKQSVNVTIKQPAQGYGTASFTTTAETEWVLLYWYIDGSYSPNTLSDIMLLEGEYDRYTIPDYVPYGYKIPISSGGVTTNIYIGDAPLRKSIDGSDAYDTIDSNGTLTRRVDKNGNALATPTAEQITTPVLPTLGTAEQFDILTDLKPPEVSLTYTGWHNKSDAKL